jgi:hypothetical protein
VAFFSSLNAKALRLGEDKISPSDLGVGRRLEELLLSLYDGMVKLDGVLFEIADAKEQ